GGGRQPGRRAAAGSGWPGPGTGRPPGPAAPRAAGRVAWLRRGRSGLTEPGLVGEETPDRVELVVAHPPGDHVDIALGGVRHPDGRVGDLALDRRPEGTGLRRAAEFEPPGLPHLPVGPRVAVVAVAVTAAAPEELRDVGRWVGVVGDPVTVGGGLDPCAQLLGRRGICR